MGVLEFVKKIYDPKQETVELLKNKSVQELTNDDANLESLFPNENDKNVLDTINKNVHSILIEIILDKDSKPEGIKNKNILLLNELNYFIKDKAGKPPDEMIDTFRNKYITAPGRKSCIKKNELTKLKDYGLIIDETKDIASQLSEKSVKFSSQLLDQFLSLNNQFLEKSKSPLEYNEIFSQIEVGTLEKLFYLDIDSKIQQEKDDYLNKLLLDTYKTNGFIYDSGLEKIMKKIEKIVEVKKE